MMNAPPDLPGMCAQDQLPGGNLGTENARSPPGKRPAGWASCFCIGQPDFPTPNIQEACRGITARTPAAVAGIDESCCRA
jgi:hypothetical protein